MQWKLPLLVGGLILGLGAALSITAYVRVKDQTANAVHQRLSGVVSQISDLLGKQGEAIGKAAVATTSIPEVSSYLRQPTPNGATAAFAALRTKRGGDTSVVATVFRDPSGQVLASDGPVAPLLAPLLDRRELPPGSTDTGGVGRFRQEGNAVYFPTIVLRTDSARTLGYVVFWRKLNSAPSSPLSQLIGSDAMLLMGSLGGAWVNEAGATVPPALPAAPGADGLYRYDRGDLPVLAAAAAAKGSPWMVVVEFPARVVSEPARQFVLSTAPYTFALLVLGLLFAWLIGRRLAAPIAELTRASEAMARGELHVRVPEQRMDEIGRLAASFNRMATRIAEEAEARAASESQWRSVFDRSPHPKWVEDAGSGRILAVNTAACATYGHSAEEFLALRRADFTSSSEPTANAGTTAERHKTRAGETIDVEVTTHDLQFAGQPARSVLAVNVTARNLLEQSFRQAQKMQAIGRLAGGVAHDFNNFLTAIGAYAELARDGLPEDDQRRGDLEEILRASAQATRLTRQLLAFSRQQVLQPAVLDVDSAVHAMSDLLRRLVREDITVILKLRGNHARVRIDPGHLEQILMNLVVNARDAMPRGGPVEISTVQQEVDEGSITIFGIPKGGKYAVIAVADRGVGMSVETKSRIFEPFFTTKDPGHGTGLGLATVYGIVSQNGGHITVYSEEGVGTTFRVYLPLITEAAEPEIVSHAPSPSLRGKETILLVEDEASVRNAAQQALERQGYKVIPCTDPAHALAQIAVLNVEIDLVVSDVVMPNGDGPTLIAQLRATRPKLKALLMSGYAGDSLPRIDERGYDVPFIEKPFTVMGFAKKVREVLDG